MKSGDQLWWDIVQTSPMHEAERLLRNYKMDLLEANPQGCPTYAAAGLLISRVNAEIHRLAQVQQRARLTQAIKNICGDDVAAQVAEEAARLEHLAGLEFGRGR